MKRTRRHGFSLLEVLLATSILVGSSIVLLELVTIGSRHASAARNLSKSELICQTKLNEILSRAAPVEAVRPTPVENEPSWVYWVELRPIGRDDLVALEVTAAFEPAPAKQSARFTLVRWVREPRSQAEGDRQNASAPGSSLPSGVAGAPNP